MNRMTAWQPEFAKEESGPWSCAVSKQVDLGESALLGHPELIWLPYLVLNWPSQHQPCRQLLILEHLRLQLLKIVLPEEIIIITPLLILALIREIYQLVDEFVVIALLELFEATLHHVGHYVFDVRSLLLPFLTLLHPEGTLTCAGKAL